MECDALLSLMDYHMQSLEVAFMIAMRQGKKAPGLIGFHVLPDSVGAVCDCAVDLARDTCLQEAVAAGKNYAGHMISLYFIYSKASSSPQTYAAVLRAITEFRVDPVKLSMASNQLTASNLIACTTDYDSIKQLVADRKADPTDAFGVLRKAGNMDGAGKLYRDFRQNIMLTTDELIDFAEEAAMHGNLSAAWHILEAQADAGLYLIKEMLKQDRYVALTANPKRAFILLWTAGDIQAAVDLYEDQHLHSCFSDSEKLCFLREITTTTAAAAASLALRLLDQERDAGVGLLVQDVCAGHIELVLLVATSSSDSSKAPFRNTKLCRKIVLEHGTPEMLQGFDCACNNSASCMCRPS